MLISFSVENYKSFLEDNVLTMEASAIDEFQDLNTFDVSKYRLLKSSFIFGPNSSGKSNFLDAFYNMRLSVLKSFSSEDFFSKSNEKVFKLNVLGEKKPTTFKIEFLIEYTRYYYEFSILDGKVVKELLSKDIKREVIIFERKSSDAKSNIYISSSYRKMSNSMKYVRPNALIISTLSYLNDDLSNKITNWFKNIDFINSENINISDSIYEERINNYINQIKLADHTIDKFRVEEVDIDPKTLEKLQLIQKITEIDIPSKVPDLKYIAKKYNEEHELIGNIELDFDQMSSSGTQNFANLIVPIMDALETGSIIVIDELESMLHVSLVKYIFGLFNSIDLNKSNAQLITTTHDVFILNENIRRDQINFVEKNIYGESSLYSLVDFKSVTKSDNLLRKYLLGFYGAVPNLGDLIDAKVR